MNRRDFFKNYCLLPAVFPFYNKVKTGPLPANFGYSEILKINSKKLHRIDDDINTSDLFKILYSSLDSFSNNFSWAKIFNKSQKVALKVSCLPGKKLSTSVGLIKAIVECLKRSGVKPENIYIWERTKRELMRAGFFKGLLNCQVVGNDELPNGGYSRRVYVHKSIGSCFSQILEKVDCLISVPVLKDHDISGVSIGMKNFFGAIHNPNKYHSNNCDPFIADLNSHSLIRNKLKLIICDATRIQYHNGPAYSPGHCIDYGSILISQDPVAIDYYGWMIIEKMRKKFNYPDLKSVNRYPNYIFTASKNGLGQALMDKIKVKEIEG